VEVDDDHVRGRVLEQLPVFLPLRDVGQRRPPADAAAVSRPLGLDGCDAGLVVRLAAALERVDGCADGALDIVLGAGEADLGHPQGPTDAGVAGAALLLLGDGHGKAEERADDGDGELSAQVLLASDR